MMRDLPLPEMVRTVGDIGYRYIERSRYIVNPPGSTARVHQHLDIGQGEVNWSEFFGTLRELKFDGIATMCVFAWVERAQASAEFNLARVTHELEGAAARR